MRNLDPTSITIISRGLHAAAAEMGANLVRSAFSTVVREAQDCSTALIDVDGNVVAQADMIPVQTAAIGISFKESMKALAIPRIEPGYAILMNDPYFGGQHLNDLILFTPIYHDGGLLGYSGSTAHHLDIGGGVAGVNATATELLQEGLIFPPTLFEIARDWNGGLLESFLAANVRTPEIAVGDMNAQFAANYTGEQRLCELADKFGAHGVRQAMAAVQDYSERRIRAAFEHIPDGTYKGEAFIDQDVFDPKPIRIAVELRIEGSDIWMDFADTDPQLKSMFNCPVASAHAAAFAAMRSIIPDKDLPSNDGCNRPLHLSFAKGTLLNPHRPAAVRARMTSAYRTFDAVHDALSKAMPDWVPAQGYNCTTAFYIWQRRKDGRYRIFVDILGGGYGAGRDYDGESAVANILGNCRNTPVESIEQIHDHLRIRSYAMLPDSGGAGEWRGGLGMCREFTVLEDDVVLNLYADRFKFAPQGFHAGQPGNKGSLSVIRGDQVIPLGATAEFALERGDVVRLAVGGGGGFGDPGQRPREKIERDIEDQRITLDHAAEAYGYQPGAAH
ncbi:MAG: hydantoinase B/oxoprolinase family protein [Alphaproteobacteria bacterium]